MKTAHALRLSGAAAALGGALRLVAASIPPQPDSIELELLYFIIDLALLFGLIGIYVSEGEQPGRFGPLGFVVTMTGLASIVGPDMEVVGNRVYVTASAVIGIGPALMGVAIFLFGRFPRWIPGLWIGSLLAGNAATVLPDKHQAAFLIAKCALRTRLLGGAQ
jgi:hypothetical protein